MLDNVKFFHTSNSAVLGNEIADLLGITPGKLYQEEFSDGEVFVRFDESVRNQSVIILGQANMPYSNLFELFLAIDAAHRASAKEVFCIIPYLPHARQERKDKDRAAIAARVIADFFESVGVDRVIIVDLHTSSIEGLFKVPVDHLDTTKLFVEHIKQQNHDQICLCSPDFGGVKRIKRYKSLLGCDIAVMNKERLKANQIGNMEIIGEVSGKHVVLIDDIIDTAGTLCKAAELLMESGALSVTAYCTHALLSGDARARINQSPINKVYTSNTIAGIAKCPEIEVISCAGLIKNAITKLFQ